MHKLLILCAVQAALLAGLCHAQASVVPPPPTDPQLLLKAAAPFYDFNAANLKPWHLKATYQLYDLNGKPAEQGTWEYWWASPKVHRSSWTRGNTTKSVWSTEDGYYSQQSGQPLRYFERRLGSLLLTPIPVKGLLDSSTVKLGLQRIPVKTAQLDCVTVTRLWMKEGKLEAPTVSRAEDYCFEPSLLALRLSYKDFLVYEYNELVKTQGKFLTKQLLIMNGAQKAFSVTVETLETISPQKAALTPPADATFRLVPSGDLGDETGGSLKISSGMPAGSLLKKTPPDYPYVAKMTGEQGTVILAATIGTDGRVRDLEVLSSPSPLLAQAAVDAVKSWEYKPYLLNGIPVEVETSINVIFSLGR